jgi:hypothetical protein
MNSKIIDKSLLSNWLLTEILHHYGPTPNYTILKGFRILKILKFIKLDTFSSTNSGDPDDFELHCILSDSNHSIIAKLSKDTIYGFERDNKARITENTINTIIMVHNAKLEWISRQSLLQKFALGNDFMRQLRLYSNNKMNNRFDEFGTQIKETELQTFAILYIDSDDMDTMRVLDIDQDKVNRSIRPIYFTDNYVKKVRPIKVGVDEDDDEFTM